MPASIKWRSCIILAKIETTYGTDSAPVGANAILMTDVSLTPMEGAEVGRDLLYPYLGAQEDIPHSLRAVLSGKTELVGSGTAGTAPAWGVLARACGLAQVASPGVSVVYSPVSDNHESLSGYVWYGSTRHVMTGARGTGVLSINAQGIPTINWTLTGLWSQPSEQARPTPDFAPWKKPQIASSANTPTMTIGGVSLVLRSLGHDLGNQVSPRLLIGREEIIIEDRAELISATVEAVPMTTFNPFDKARQGSDASVAVSVVHGTTAGRIATLAASKCQVSRLTSYENAQGVVEWPLRMRPLPTAGNDEFSLTLT